MPMYTHTSVNMASGNMCLSTILSAPGVRGKMVTSLPKDGVVDFIKSTIINNQEFSEPFYVLDLGVVEALMDQWTRTLPTVQPYYAVKCNPEPAFLGTMAALGASFDCASRSEIETVLSLGVSPDRVIYANPCKAESHIKYAASVGVNLTTFDSKFEIDKIRKYHPKCDLLIRIKVPEHGAKCTLSSKFGALTEEVTPLLQAANAAGLTVSGVSFHVGSGGTHSRAYREAIAAAKTVFDTASRLSLPRMRVLNIGGGFTYPLFDDVANTVKSAIQMYFGHDPALTVIAEPGRFFAESAFTLATKIIGKRVRGNVREYWINDGIYGSMNCVLNNHTTFTITPVFACTSNPTNPMCRGVKKTFSSTVFGPSCDALDTLLVGHWLPELQVNDWFFSPKMGAYTSAGGCNFNGFNLSAISTYLAYSSPI